MNAPLLRELRQIYQSRSPEERPAAERDLREALKKLPKDVIQKVAQDDIGKVWRPNLGQQIAAYHCKADILLYGGASGGGKTDLILGLAFTAHQRSLILRRQYTQLSALTERAIEINQSRKGFNGSIPPKFRLPGRLIEFGAAEQLGSEQAFQGQPHDLLAFDEATFFTETQVRYLLTWVRTTDKRQRCRVVLASNPPIDATGDWLIRFFAPWLDPMYENRAKPGELRWYITGDDDQDTPVDGPDPVKVGGREILPMSRTFIPAKVTDNPWYANDAIYLAKLDSLREPFRSAYRDGNFMLARRDARDQLIPSRWLMDAQSRWTPAPPPGIPMCAMGVDCSGGGNDPLVIAPRHDGWFANLIEVPGSDLPMDRLGSYSAGQVVSYRRDNAVVIVDMGGGYGGPLYEHLKANEIESVAYKGAESTMKRTEDNQMGFYNTRSAAYYGFREALDPDQPGGSPIALPPDPVLMAELSTPTYATTPRGFKIQTKEDVMAVLGRSPNRSDAVVMSWWKGPKAATHAEDWQKGIATKRKRGRMPTVIRAHEAQRAFLRR